MALREIQHIMGRTVHRLERHVMLIRLFIENEEHVLPILAPVPGLLPQRLVVDQWCLDLLKLSALALADEVDEGVVQEGATLGPESGPGRNNAHDEQIELATELAMVAALRLLDAEEVGVEIFLIP